jgi:hypothetical protein
VILPKGCQFTPQAKGLGGWTLKPRSRLRYSCGLGSGRPEIAFDQGPQLRGHFGRFAEPRRAALKEILLLPLEMLERTLKRLVPLENSERILKRLLPA